MSQYYRCHPDEPIRHDWISGSRDFLSTYTRANAGIVTTIQQQTSNTKTHMAIRNLSQAVGSLTYKDRVPSNTKCVARCINEEFKPSKSTGNPMIVREWEIVLPETVNVNGTPKIIAGQKLMQYLPTIVLGPDGTRDDEKSNKALSRVRDENDALGISNENFDDENPNLEAKGLQADILVSSEERELRTDPTPEELAQGKTVGQPILGDDNKPMKRYSLRLAMVLGRSTVDTGRPY